MIRLLLCLQVSLGSPFFSLSASATEKAHLDGPAQNPIYVRQEIINLTLNQILPKLNAAKNSSDLLKLLPAGLSKRDLAYFRRNLQNSAKLPKFEHLNRGIGFKINGKVNTLTIEDVFVPQFRLNNKFDFVYHAGNPVEVQIDVLRRGLKKSQVSIIDLLLPKAEAIFGIDDAAIVAFALGAIVMPVIAKVVQAAYSAGTILIQDHFCADKTPSSGYWINWLCSDYFAWKAENKTTVPYAADTTALKNISDHMTLKKRCQTKDDPNMTMENTMDDGSYMRTTVKFDTSRKPVQIVTYYRLKDREMWRTYDLLPDASLRVLRDEKGQVLATTDKDATATMDSTKFDANADNLNQANQFLKNLNGFVESCNQEVQAAIQATATQASDTRVASQSQPISPVAPLVPATTTGEVPTSK